MLLYRLKNNQIETKVLNREGTVWSHPYIFSFFSVFFISLQRHVVTKCAPENVAVEAHFVTMQLATKWADHCGTL
jgi:hypothetical protein